MPVQPDASSLGLLHHWEASRPVTGASTYMLCACRNDTGYGTWGKRELHGEAGTELPQTSGSLLPECAKVFHAAGAKLVLCGRNREALEQLARELAASRASEVSPRVRLLGKGSVRPLPRHGPWAGGHRPPQQLLRRRPAGLPWPGPPPPASTAPSPSPAGTCPALLLAGRGQVSDEL